MLFKNRIAMPEGFNHIFIVSIAFDTFNELFVIRLVWFLDNSVKGLSVIQL